MASGPTETAPTISTHVLDTGLGRPAVGVHVTLYRLSDDGRPLRLTQALTDGDGRVRDLLERP
ncbi:MAG: hydroxyisourate hydrolase, partial [Chloroflexi bacterium]|nr:hydroxyisourate hydrolase [Chloroflexota bacterium]